MRSVTSPGRPSERPHGHVFLVALSTEFRYVGSRTGDRPGPVCFLVICIIDTHVYGCTTRGSVFVACVRVDCTLAVPAALVYPWLRRSGLLARRL